MTDEEKVSRFLAQKLADYESDEVCDVLSNFEDEYLICQKECENIRPECWLRYARRVNEQ